MKRLILLALCLLALAGCVRLPGVDLIEVLLVGDQGALYAPKINDMAFGYDANVQAGDLIRMDFNPGIDQYGNRTGLSSSRYVLDEVTVKCDLKTEFDTIFEIDDVNVVVWFPGYTAPLDAISGLPVPFYPLEGYPWDSCRDTGIPDMAAQQATITATAQAAWIEVKFVLPDKDGTYLLDLPGQTATSDNVITIKIDEAGEYRVVHSEGEVYEFDVPIDWFFIEGEWLIDVGPTGVC